MNKKLLCAALLAGIGFVQAANAQEFDDRWYLTGSVGYNFQDSDRTTDSAPFGTIGLGKFITPNWSVDGELNYQNPNMEANDDLNWSQYGISFDARYHFINEGRSWNPYLLAGLGYQRSEEEYDNFPSPNSPMERKDGHVAGKLGVGVQSTLARRVGVRAELAYRIDADNDSIGALASDPNHDDGEDWFGDILASVGVVIPLGPEPT
ncbi:porin family protein, partial [Luteimonas notoginsengisoli]